MWALTIRHPWAAAIVHGPKRVENRSWKLTMKYGPRWVAIHAGLAAPDPDLLRELATLWPGALDVMPMAASAGHIIGVAHFAGCVPYATAAADPWSVEQPEGKASWCWVVDEVRACEPVEAKGQLGVWKVDADVAARVRATSRRVPAAETAWDGLVYRGAGAQCGEPTRGGDGG